MILRPEGPERLAVGQHYLLGERPWPAERPFYLFHLAGADREIFLRRRRQMTQRQGQRNVQAGYSVEHTAQSEEAILRRWQQLAGDPRQVLLPVVG